MATLGENIRRLRTAKDMRQAAFAERIGVHVTNLSKYERSHTLPSLEVAERMAEVLEVSLDELVRGTRDERARHAITDDQLLQLFAKTQRLDDHHRRTVADLLSAFLLKADLTQQLA